ncbi:MAG: hypothetical protein WCG27_01080 [Pseudomonadota bacterium]
MRVFIFLTLLFVSFIAATGENLAPSCFQAGKTTNVGGYDSSPSVSMSKNKNWALVNAYNDNKSKIIDVHTGKIEEIPTPAESIVDFVGDDKIGYSTFTDADTHNPQKLLEQLQNIDSTIIDLKTKASETIHGKFIFFNGSGLCSPLSADKKGIVYKTENGTTKRFDLGAEDSEDVARWAEDSSDPGLSYNIKEKKLIFKEEGKTEFQIPYVMDMGGHAPDSLWSDGEFSPDKRFFTITKRTQQREGEQTVDIEKATIVDLQKKEVKNVKLPKNSYFDSLGINFKSKKYDPNSRLRLLSTYGQDVDGVYALDVQTGSVKKIFDTKIERSYFGGPEEICGEINDAGGQGQSEKRFLVCYNLKTKQNTKRVFIPFVEGDISQINADSYLISLWGSNGQQSQVFLYHPRKVCPNNPISFSCSTDDPNGKALAVVLDVMAKNNLSQVCSKNFLANDWDGVTPYPVKNFDTKEALLWLKRFSKPGGFEADKHIDIILAILNAGLQKSYPAEVLAALNGVLSESDELYDELIQKYPSVAGLELKPNNSCLSDKEKEDLNKTIFHYSKLKITGKRRPTIEDFEKIANLVRFNLSAEQRDKLADIGGDQLVVSAGDSYTFNKMFPSKIYKFSYNKLKKLFGLDYHNLTDLTLVRDNDNLVYYILGNESFDGAEKTPEGIWLKKINSTAIADLELGKKTNTLSWNYSGQEFNAKVTLDKYQITKKIVSEEKSPDYARMLKDGTFHGLVVAGSNLGSATTDDTISEYIDYYTKQGFEFDPPKLEKNLVGLIKSRVSGDEPMHYFIKEAHSDGDEKNLFRIDKEGMVQKGVKKVGDRTEIVEIVFPAKKNRGDTTLLSNTEFGKWVKEREKKDGPELVYVNSSCWSEHKACYEISSAASPKFINIATTTSMTTFGNNKKNVMYALVDGLRNQKTYAAIRKDMEEDAGYVERRKNVFIFPDEEDYQKRITQTIKTPVDVDVSLSRKDSSGQFLPYSIEEIH